MLFTIIQPHVRVARDTITLKYGIYRFALNINLTSKHWGNISKGKLSTARYKKLYLNAIVGCLGPNA